MRASLAGRGGSLKRTHLSHVIDVDSVRFVDVNEDNGQAVTFYRRRGFDVIGRSDVDDDGRPYPLLRMERAASGRVRCCAIRGFMPRFHAAVT